jgi:hypothetical protein
MEGFSLLRRRNCHSSRLDKRAQSKQTECGGAQCRRCFSRDTHSSITRGRSQIELMNIINPDAMTLGNHEFDYGLENLEKDLSLAHFPIMNANIFDERNGKNFQEP